MFIALDIENGRKPRRGGMAMSGLGPAALTGLEEMCDGLATINMSLLRSFVSAGRRWEQRRPNKRAGGDRGMMLFCLAGRPWLATPQHEG